ncbi:MAG: hypothetical protein KatS3mg032_0726 [Cyclobacteriaceae bacterium]|nr:MAG: hypothetical protein KatS3mg032_0726 [Cyclobacteriaceae bacterium]
MNQKKSIWIFVAVTGLLGACETPEIRKQRLLLRGNEALEHQSYAEAIRLYAAALDIDSCYAEALNNWGTTLHRQKDYAQAAEKYSRALMCKPDYVNAWLNRANTWFEMKQYERSLHDAQAVLKLADTVPAYFISGIACAAMGRHEEAKQWFRRVLMRQQENAEAAVNLAIAMYYRMEYDSAEQVLAALLQQQPDEAEAWNTRGMVALAMAAWDDAIGYFNTALRLKDNAWYLNNRGYAWLMKGNYNLALSDINESLARDPQNAWAYRNKGIYYLLTGEPASAVRLLEQAAAMDERVEDVYAWLAEAHAKAGNITEACRYARLSAERGERKKAMADC